jgi:hypothetical protein
MYKDFKELLTSSPLRRLIASSIVVILLSFSLGNFNMVNAAADFELSNLEVTPSEVEPGESITIAVMVKNVGDESGTYEVTFVVDQEVMGKETVNLNKGESKSVSYTMSSRARIGIHTIKVDGLTGIYTVVEAEESKPFPWYLVGIAIIIILAVLGYIFLKR